MTAFDTLLDRFGRWLARHLGQEAPGEEPFIPSDPAALRRSLRMGDVLLIAGSGKLSTAIKYLTEPTWSHAALYVGDVLNRPARWLHLGTSCQVRGASTRGYADPSGSRKRIGKRSSGS